MYQKLYNIIDQLYLNENLKNFLNKNYWHWRKKKNRAWFCLNLLSLNTCHHCLSQCQNQKPKRETGHPLTCHTSSHQYQVLASQIDLKSWLSASSLVSSFIIYHLYCHRQLLRFFFSSTLVPPRVDSLQSP